MERLRKNAWTTSENALFYYWVRFSFRKRDTVAFLSNFCSLFFELADKYEILSNNQLHDSPVYRAYIDNYNQYLKHHFNWSKFILPLLVSDVRETSSMGEIIQPVTKMSFYDNNENLVSEKVRHLWNVKHQAKFIKAENIDIFHKEKAAIIPVYSNPLTITPWPIDITNKALDDKVTYDFGIKSYSDIWLDKVADYKFLDPDVNFEKRLNRVIDNRPLAYRHTPRLNSFLRSLKAIVLEYDGKWTFDSTHNGLQLRTNMKIKSDEDSDKIWSDCAIPLDGKFIYQEDIDEGRIKIPD